MKTFTFTASFLAMTIVLFCSFSTAVARNGHRASPASYGNCSGGCTSTYTISNAACESLYPKGEHPVNYNECIQNVAINLQKCEATCMQQQ
ncbi:hypothetical protein BGZ92_011548 [Podila epicladia]|nr:hypothetical protein BGZ92_011548 [Podila epicladia]